MQKNNPLGTAKIPSLLVQFSVPAILGMVVNSIYNIVDRIFIGNAPALGSNGLAGITIGFPLMILLMSTGLLFGVGGATLFAMKLGERDHEAADRALNTSFLLLLISGTVFFILGQIFLTPLLRLFGASETVLPYAEEYMRVIFFGAIFQVVSMGMNNFLRAAGKPRLAMITMLVGAIINIMLDWIFIFVFHMGMAGAALATILAQLASMVWILSYFMTDRSPHRISLKQMKMKKNNVFQITSLGMPLFIMQIGNSLLNIILNKSLFIYGGDIAVSGMGIVNSVMTLLLMPIVGLNQGVQPIVSFNYGAKSYNRIKETEKLAITVATVFAVIGWILTRVFPAQIVSFFNQEPDLISFGTYALKAWFLATPVLGFQIIGANFFQAIGRSKSAMILTLTRQVLFLIPAILLFSWIWGIDGLLYAAPFADSFAAFVTGIWFYYGMKRLSQLS